MYLKRICGRTCLILGSVIISLTLSIRIILQLGIINMYVSRVLLDVDIHINIVASIFFLHSAVIIAHPSLISRHIVF